MKRILLLILTILIIIVIVIAASPTLIETLDTSLFPVVT